jgi:mRNA interferase MazF
MDRARLVRASLTRVPAELSAASGNVRPVPPTGRYWSVRSRGDVWRVFGVDLPGVVILSTGNEPDLRGIYVVPAAETDITGVAIELAVGREEGLDSGVVRVALARTDRINCSWLVSLNETDLKEQTGVLSEEKLSKLGEMLRLGGLE